MVHRKSALVPLDRTMTISYTTMI